MKKKWFIVILILVIVAVVLTIVFINLFKERDTKALTSKLIEVTETGYLHRNEEDEKSENTLLHEYLSYLETLIGEFSDTAEIDQKERAKITNYDDALSAYEVAVGFFAREMLFAEATETYTNEHKKIESLLDSAQKKANEMKQYLEDLASKTGDPESPEDTTGGKAYWTARSWSDCYKKVTDIVNDTAKAITKLSQVYQKSVPIVVSAAEQGYSNNTLSDVIFVEMNNMLQNITTKADSDAGFGSALYTFVNAYLSKENETIILEYVFSEDLQKKAKDLKEKGAESQFYESFIVGQLRSAI